jgi:hypothetical protein
VADLHVRLAGEGEQTVEGLCYREPQFVALVGRQGAHGSRVEFVRGGRSVKASTRIIGATSLSLWWGSI